MKVTQCHVLNNTMCAFTCTIVIDCYQILVVFLYSFVKSILNRLLSTVNTTEVMINYLDKL